MLQDNDLNILLVSRCCRIHTSLIKGAQNFRRAHSFITHVRLAWYMTQLPGGFGCQMFDDDDAMALYQNGVLSERQRPENGENGKSSKRRSHLEKVEKKPKNKVIKKQLNKALVSGKRCLATEITALSCNCREVVADEP